METAFSLLYPQESTISPYLKSINPIHTFQTYCPKIHFNVIL
jgi:hypothetical protein